jgi:hypothetical protein
MIEEEIAKTRLWWQRGCCHEDICRLSWSAFVLSFQATDRVQANDILIEVSRQEATGRRYARTPVLRRNRRTIRVDRG